MAGLIGAATNNGHGIAGIHWGVRLMPLKIMNVSRIFSLKNSTSSIDAHCGL